MTNILIAVMGGLGLLLAVLVAAAWGVRTLRKAGARLARLDREGIRTHAVVTALKTEWYDGEETLVRFEVRYTSEDGVERRASFKWGVLTYLPHGGLPAVGDVITVVYLPGSPAKVELETTVRTGPRL